MPELVDGEVEAVEPAVMGRVENQEPAVQREQRGEGEARAPLEAGGTSRVAYRASWDWRAAVTLLLKSLLYERLAAGFPWSSRV